MNREQWLTNAVGALNTHVFLPKGVEAGAVRDQYPPRVTQDNPAIAGLGNILMV